MISTVYVNIRNPVYMIQETASLSKMARIFKVLKQPKPLHMR